MQGVGFRPFVYGLATELALTGWVRNDGDGVYVEVEGPKRHLSSFAERVVRDAPTRARIQHSSLTWSEAEGFETFEIRHSDGHAPPTVVVLADGATCDACMAEVRDPNDRRYRYPFTNCTDCGPRFTIVKGLPYDRPLTTMAGFAFCDDCRREYEDPLDRRFHAQPNACPVCGPHVELWDAEGNAVAKRNEAIHQAGQALREGKILAAKGIGGFHLMVDAANESAVARLRRRKLREEKPLAIMAGDLDQARAICTVSDDAAALLASPESPIALMRRRDDADVAPSVAPGNPRLGVMLPSSAFHHLLLEAAGRPLVATSGNRSDEPICTSNEQALADLADIADVFLVHDRPIARHVDDSVVLVDDSETRPVRRARGYAPLPVNLGRELPTILAVGGHLKNTIALAVGSNVFLSQHIGDLDTPRARDAFENVIRDFLDMYEVTPELLVHDLHPDYASTAWVERLSRADERPTWAEALADIPRLAVQHHHAHLAACLAEHGVDGPALGVSWDGTGYGDDGTIWGGEFLLGVASGYARVASLRPFRLPGGEAAVKEPRRTALALALDAIGERAFDTAAGTTFNASERTLIASMLAKGVNAPVTTSAGRLFDGVAALLDIRQTVSFEGQAPMELEAVADPEERGTYPFPLVTDEGERPVLDWRPLVEALLEDRTGGTSIAVVSARFHESLAEGIARVVDQVEAETVALSGGCFLNARLLRRTRERLEAAGRRVLVHREVPPGDGGISLGQVAVAAAHLASREER